LKNELIVESRLQARVPAVNRQGIHELKQWQQKHRID
jgi:hypothetical protein